MSKLVAIAAIAALLLIAACCDTVDCHCYLPDADLRGVNLDAAHDVNHNPAPRGMPRRDFTPEPTPSCDPNYTPGAREACCYTDAGYATCE